MRVILTGHGKLAQAFLRVNPSAEVHSFRTLEDQAIISVIEDADVIVHNAACTDSSEGLSGLMDDNFVFTRRLVDLVCACVRQPRFINIGSMSYLKKSYEYLDPLEMSAYAFSKFVGETYCLKAIHRAISVRFSTLYYKDPDKDGLSSIILQAVRERRIIAYNRGEQKRDVIPIEIAVRYLNTLVEADMSEQQVNICSGQEIVMSDLIAFIATATGASIVNKDVEDNRFVLSRFSERDIVRLGKLDFLLVDHIAAHIKELGYA